MLQLINKIWYGDLRLLQWVLYPFSGIYILIIHLRRWYLQRFCQASCPVPLIVIGNISVGGVGKTPLVIALAQQCKERGLSVGIVSRGYGARIKRKQFPYQVQLDDDAYTVGDEPLLLAQKTLCPVVIAPQRMAAVHHLLKYSKCDIILSDDGLQHYKMSRSIEIAVIDGTRGLGNGLCLPAGPLREPAARLRYVDYVIVNEGSWDKAYSMRLVAQNLIQLNTSQAVSVSALEEQSIAAVAGIGNPQRFYSTLEQLGLKFIPYSYPDHYQFKLSDFNYGTHAVIMTEKDAIKCRSFSTESMYALSVKAVLDDSFWDDLWSHQQLQGLC